MESYQRHVYFKDGICVGVGTGAESKDHNFMLVMPIPSDHYDFIGAIGNFIIDKHISVVIETLYKPRPFYTEHEKDIVGWSLREIENTNIWTKD